MLRPLRKQVDRLTRRDSTIIEHRVLRRPPTTLVVLGAQFGVSPRRVQYLQARAESRISIAFGGVLPYIARELMDELGPNADVNTAHSGDSDHSFRRERDQRFRAK